MFRSLLNSLRLSMPKTRGGSGWTVVKICRGRKAWSGNRPTVADIARLFSKHPDTTVLTISRRGVQEINAFALEAFYGNSEPLVVLPGDIESNPANYDEESKLFKDPKKLKPLPVPTHKGMLVYLTRNVRKDVDFVNGMLARVEDFDHRSKGIRLVTNTGKRFSAWNWTDKELHNLSYYPNPAGLRQHHHQIPGCRIDTRHGLFWMSRACLELLTLHCRASPRARII